eukprot:m.271933 g.271933  ORF g.271933 m.271933 type:complete len:420 (-) comp98142_c0_seq1:30-1289(-)
MLPSLQHTGARVCVSAFTKLGYRNISTSRTCSTRQVYVAGQGRVKVTRKHNQTLEVMGRYAIHEAMKDANVGADSVTGLYVGNMMSGMLSKQQHLGPLLAWSAGLGHVDCATAEACCGAGGAALRWGYMAIASGLHDTVIVAGVEQMTHTPTDQLTQGLAAASHWETEGGRGETFVSLNAALMRLYMDQYSAPHSAFAPFAITAHDNALKSEHAVFHKHLDQETHENAMMLTDPVQLFDACPTCDGAAAIVLTADRDTARRHDGSVVRIAGSGASSDLLPVHARPTPLHLHAVERSMQQALSQGGVTHTDVDVFELHDAYTIMACLSLESAGFVPQGEGTQFAADGHISPTGSLPIATFGGLKARGHPVGATGVYQAAECFLQTAHEAGANQVEQAQVVAMQNIGGAGSSVFAHIFTRE